jgi:hypothetical protein
VQAAIATVREMAAKAGKVCGILATITGDADRYIADGFLMVAVGSDLGLLARGSDALIASRRLGTDHPRRLPDLRPVSFQLRAHLPEQAIS